MLAARLIGAMGLAALLSGCFGSQEDLRSWMREERAKVKPRVEQISEPKRFEAQNYAEGMAVEPFSNVKLTQALRRDTGQPGHSDLLAVELNRRKEALEAFPLDTMAMVGTLDRNGQRVALLMADKLLYQVRVGNHLGMNYGRITRIDETELALREIVQDAAGEWIERPVTLQLQEKASK
ncbi:pilus assembly protein PilP [Ralstonia sp.]|uniref:pilus assembly protein PilP n=1 Tax=Ralstonia sp. TaxID=54061 RepID=UPI002C07B935|nr:pilus assembly protein PilP [Ralstonia sp.]HWV03131.1 pilus assembly protein PilP [Ralstonia sp.]